MKVTDLGHTYEVTGQTITFIKRKGGELINEGTTNEELLEVLLDRTRFLNAQFPCTENEISILGMEIALKSFNQRTKARVAQGVETKDANHVS